MTSTGQLYPFPAVLGGDPDAPGGLDDMALALVLSVIDPGIGGVLVRGEKGTAKSTLVRALTQILPPIDVVAGDRFSTDPAEHNPASPDGAFGPDAPVQTRPVSLVELSVGATEDRVAGSIDLQQALADGAVHFEPGLLAKAHRGILYVDEVNLLHDHLVDLLLDAAAMGMSPWNATAYRSPTRRGSCSSARRIPKRVSSSATTRPLRPRCRGSRTAGPGAAARSCAATAVRRRPAGFPRPVPNAEERLRDRIQHAQSILAHIQVTDAALLRIAEVCSAAGVDGMRADIVMARAAAAHAAWHDRDHPNIDDLRAAAKLALPHRRRRNPFDAPGLDDSELDELLPPDTDQGPDPDPDTDPDGPGGGHDTHDIPDVVPPGSAAGESDVHATGRRR